MRRLASVCLVVGATAWAAPNGRVVRVERNRGMKTVPRLCDVQPIAKEGLCVGQPSSGDRVTLIDQDKGVAVGEFRIDSSPGPAQPFVCSGAQPLVFQIKGGLTAGEPYYDMWNVVSTVWLGAPQLYAPPQKTALQVQAWGFDQGWMTAAPAGSGRPQHDVYLSLADRHGFYDYVARQLASSA
jgi:hypothetical protein